MAYYSMPTTLGISNGDWILVRDYLKNNDRVLLWSLLKTENVYTKMISGHLNKEPHLIHCYSSYCEEVFGVISDSYIIKLKRGIDSETFEEAEKLYDKDCDILSKVKKSENMTNLLSLVLCNHLYSIGQLNTYIKKIKDS